MVANFLICGLAKRYMKQYRLSRATAEIQLREILSMCVFDRQVLVLIVNEIGLKCKESIEQERGFQIRDQLLALCERFLPFGTSQRAIAKRHQNLLEPIYCVLHPDS
jgi:hypothetical protein